jgi:hydroxymethylbilane synthase
MSIRIATRRSKLALAQSNWVKSCLEALEPGLTVELREYVTRGDQVQNVPLSEVGGKGLFTKEIEEALLNGEADLAVHSLKDLPSELPAGLVLGAIPEREDARDVLVLPASHPAHGAVESNVSCLDLLPQGARVGSGSLRRMAQLLHERPDLRVENVRGNVDTRLRKLDEGQYDALVLAAAGLRRLGLAHRISVALPAEMSTPAPGQGALGLEARADDTRMLDLLARLNHAESSACVAAERALMDAVGGGCSVPLGGYARVRGDRLELLAVLAAADGKRVVREMREGALADPAALGREVAEKLLASGGREILDALGK